MGRNEREGRGSRVPLPEMTSQDALSRWPRICAHLICHSLGYATPTMAASIMLAAARREKHYCEWIDACYQDDPLPALQRAIRTRYNHHGYMADYGLAKRLVEEAIKKGDPCIFASWF